MKTALYNVWRDVASMELLNKLHRSKSLVISKLHNLFCPHLGDSIRICFLPDNNKKKNNI